MTSFHCILIGKSLTVSNKCIGKSLLISILMQPTRNALVSYLAVLMYPMLFSVCTVKLLSLTLYVS